MIKIVCKFTCNEKTTRIQHVERLVQGKSEYVPAPVHSVEMAPVYHENDPEHENSQFWDATPCGKLEIGCTRPDALEALEAGEEYYVTISDRPL